MKNPAFDEVLRRVVTKTQADLQALNDSPHRDKLTVAYELQLYNACQELVDCIDSGDDGGKLLIDREAVERAQYSEWLKTAEQNDYQNAPFMVWGDIMFRLMIQIRLDRGEITEDDLKKAHDDAFRNRGM